MVAPSSLRGSPGAVPCRPAAVPADETNDVCAGLYGVAAERVRLFRDPDWRRRHGLSADQDREAAALLEQEAPAPWRDSGLDFSQVSVLVEHFPAEAWQACGGNLRQLWDEWQRQESRAAVRCKQEQQAALRQQEREGAHRDSDHFIDRELRDRLLLHLRAGAWHPLPALRKLLEEWIPVRVARRRAGIDTESGEVDREATPERGRELLLEDTLTLLEGLHLLERRQTGARVEVRSTPWQAADPNWGLPEIQWDDEFAHFLPRNPDDFAALAEQIRTDGCRHPLVVWNGQGTLLDGYTRYEILLLLGRPFRVEEKEFPDREAAKTWLWNEHRGRRNLTPEMKSDHRGREYRALKSGRGGDHTRPRANRQNDTLPNAAEVLSQRYLVSASTILRDAHFNERLDHIEEVCGPEFRVWVLTRGGHRSHRQMEQLADLSDDVLRRRVAAILK